MKPYSSWTRFVTTNRNNLLAKVKEFAERTIKGSASKISKDQYLILCESQGIDPNPEVMAKFIEVNDLPEIVQIAMEIYNNLTDTYVPGEIPIFIGKDKTALPFLYETFGIPEDLKLFVLQVINIFDSMLVREV